MTTQRLFVIGLLIVLAVSMSYAAPTWPSSWSSVGSAGGARIAVANASLMYFADGFTIYKSTDGGVTRSSSLHSSCGGGSHITTSEDGQYVYEACQSAGQYYKSTDYGATWSANIQGSNYFMQVDSSDTGQYVLASHSEGAIPKSILGQYSTDYGVSWTNVTDIFSSSGGGACIGSDGSVMTIVSTLGTYQSTNYGSTWGSTGGYPTLPVGGTSIWEVACSNDGTKLFVMVGDQSYGPPATVNVAYSFDSGATWNNYNTGYSVGFGMDVAVNSDGSYGAFTLTDNSFGDGVTQVFNTSGGTFNVPTGGKITDVGGSKTWGVDFAPDDSVVFASTDDDVQVAEMFVPVPPVPPGPTNITDCMVIDTPGEYVVVNNLTQATSLAQDACLYTDQADVVIDGQGYTITFQNTSANNQMIWFEAASHLSNITVKNLNFVVEDANDWVDVLSIYWYSDVLIQNVTFSYATQEGHYIGFYLDGNGVADNLVVEDSTFDGIEYSLVSGYSNLTMRNNQFLVDSSVAGDYGLLLDGVDTAFIYDNYFYDNDGSSFIAYDTTTNVQSYNNTFNATTLGFDFSGSTGVTFNDSVIGNAYVNPAGTGFSQTCTNNGSSICTTTYNVSGVIDYLPIALSAVSVNYNITDCRVITESGYYVLTGDLVHNTTTPATPSGWNADPGCIMVWNASDVMIDGQGYGIYLNDPSEAYFPIIFDSPGVEVQNNFTVKNITLYVNNTYDWQDGLDIVDVDGVLLQDIDIVLSPTSYLDQWNTGLYMARTDNVVIERVTSDFENALLMSDVENVTIRDSLFSSNGVAGSDYTTMYLEGTSPGWRNVVMYNNVFKALNADVLLFTGNLAIDAGDLLMYNNTFNVTMWGSIDADVQWNNSVIGNVWVHPNGTGYSQMCTNDGAGICDASYAVPAGGTDYLPIALTAAPIDGFNITDCGGTITSPGQYQLVNDVTGTGVSCINVTVPGVSIDGQGYTLNGTTVGVYYTGANSMVNAVIENMEMTLAPTGVGTAIAWVNTAGNMTFRNNTVYGMLAHYSYDGVISSAGLHVYDNVFDRQGTTVSFFLDLTTTTQYVYLSNNTISNYPQGFRKVGSSANPQNVVVSGNTFENITSWLVTDHTGGMTMYNNDFSGVSDLAESGSVNVFVLNTTAHAGTNIIGGSQIGGNYWPANDPCAGTAGGSFCSDAYEPETGVFDYLPLGVFPSAVNVSACGVTANIGGATYSVTQNISYTTGVCLQVTADDVVVDGLDYEIESTAGGRMLNISGDRVTVKNLKISAVSANPSAYLAKVMGENVTFDGVNAQLPSIRYGAGIYVEGDGFHFVNSIASHCYESYYGLTLVDVDGALIEHSVFPNSDLCTGANHRFAALSVNGASNVVVYNNSFTGGSGSAASYETLEVRNGVSGLEVVNNSFVVSDTHAFQVTTDSLTGLVMTGNTFTRPVDFATSSGDVYDNEFLSTVAKSGGTINWNTTETVGTNIIGGSSIGGNYYSANACAGTAGDTFCEDSYEVVTGEYDYLPLGVFPYNVNVTDCAVLNIKNATYHMVGNLTDKTSGSYVGCMDIQNDDVVFDCHGYTLDGTDATDRFAVRVEDYSVVQNCVFTEWGQPGSTNGGAVLVRGVFAHSAYNATIVNNTFSDLAMGIFIDKYNNNDVGHIITGNSFLSGVAYGVGFVDFDAGDIAWVYNNYFDTDNLNVYRGGGQDITDVSFNTTATTATNIVGGPTIAGNWWKGTSEVGNCVDVDRDELCDDALVVYQSYDYLPLTGLRALFSGAANVTAPEQDDAVRGVEVQLDVTKSDVDYEYITIGTGEVTEDYVYDASVITANNANARWGQSFVAIGDQLTNVQRYYSTSMFGDLSAFTVYEGVTITGTSYATRTSSADLRANPIDLVEGQNYTIYSDGTLSFQYFSYGTPYADGCSFADGGSATCDRTVAFEISVKDHNIVVDGTALENAVPDTELSCTAGSHFGSGGSGWTIFVQAQEDMYIDAINWYSYTAVSGTQSVTKYVDCTAPASVNCTTVVESEDVDIRYRSFSGAGVPFEKYVDAGEWFGIAAGALAGSGSGGMTGCTVNTTLTYPGSNHVEVYASRQKENMSYLVSVTTGDEVLSVGSYDVSGQGSMNWTEIDLRVSNLGVITGLVADESVYWITNEDPQVSWSLTGADGYGAVTTDVYLMNGAAVVASMLDVAGEVGMILPTDGTGGNTVYARSQVFTAQGTTVTHVDNVRGAGGCVLFYEFYEGSNPNSPGAYVGTVNASTAVGVCAVSGGVLVDVEDLSGFVTGQSYIAYATKGDGSKISLTQFWNGVVDSTPLATGYRWRNSAWETNLELPMDMYFVDNENYNVTFDEVVTTSYETAHFLVNVTDTLFNETDNTTNVVVDAITVPTVIGPSTEQNGDFNVTWSASTENLGVVNYTVQQSLDGGAFTLVNTTTDTYYQITADFEGDVVYQVRADDDYIETTYDNGTEFAIVLSPVLGSQVCALTYPNEDNLPSIAELPVNFSVFAPLGFTSPSVEIKLKLGGDTYSSTECSYVVVDSKNRDYSCNVSMNYWYDAGDYDLNITFTDLPKVVTVEYSGECAYGQLVASSYDISAVAFSGAGPGINNVEANQPITVRNTGNVELDLKMTAYDLSGRTNPSIKLPATAFKAGASLGTSVVMADSVQKNLSMTVVNEEDAEDDVHLWLSMPVGQLIQDYYSENAWQVVGTG